MIKLVRGENTPLSNLIRSYKLYKLNKRMDKLMELMAYEKNVVDSSFGDWDKVNLYLFKAKSTMKALRRVNNILKHI